MSTNPKALDAPNNGQEDSHSNLESIEYEKEVIEKDFVRILYRISFPHTGLNPPCILYLLL